MTAVITTAGKIRALQLLTTDITHIGVGRPDPAWTDEFNPPAENVNATSLVDIIGFARVTVRGWLQQDTGGDILIDGVKYLKVAGPTTIAYVEATVPAGKAEGVLNKIGQIGVFGQSVTTSPALEDWVEVGSIISTGTLFRIEHLPVYIKPPNTQNTFLVAFPLLV